jgi:hypothetical protein
MVVLQIAVPTSQERDVMTEAERHPEGETQRLIRDWGILLKYRNYLSCWHRLLLKLQRRLKKSKLRHQRLKRTK